MAMQPQSSLSGANAGTATPQTLQAPIQLNPYKMGNQTQMLQNMGMPTAQAVTKAAQNTANQYKAGGDVQEPPSAGQIEAQMNSFSPDADTLKAATEAMSDTKAVKNQPSDKSSNGKIHAPVSKADKETLDMFDGTIKGIDNGEYVQHKAKGGDVHQSIKKMPLQDIIKLLASHPDVNGRGAMNGGAPMQGQDMKSGGAVKPPVANLKSEARGHGLGILNMNADIGTYAQGGKVNAPPIPTYEPQVPAGTVQQQPSGPVDSVGMADGGALEVDDITGYSPDGTPIVQNSDGTTEAGSLNSLLDRPTSASTMQTGQTPVSGVSKNAANTPVAQAQQMAKGGEEGPPPGSLSKEVADDIPARLSQGEFVFSADVVRYYGLKLLTGMMEHARNELKGMENEGNIRSPGDGKDNPNVSENTGTLGQFMQDQKPDLDTYNQDGGNKFSAPQDDSDDAVTGIIKECMGGGLNQGGSVSQTGMAMGGGIAEEDFAQGGAVDSSYGNDTGFGDNNLVSSEPTGGSTLMDYAKGGIVSGTSVDLAPKKFASNIPAAKMSLAKEPKVQMPKTKAAKPISLPKFKDGGLLVKDMSIPQQSYIGA